MSQLHFPVCKGIQSKTKEFTAGRDLELFSSSDSLCFINAIRKEYIFKNRMSNIEGRHRLFCSSRVCGSDLKTTTLLTGAAPEEWDLKSRCSS